MDGRLVLAALLLLPEPLELPLDRLPVVFFAAAGLEETLLSLLDDKDAGEDGDVRLPGAALEEDLLDALLVDEEVFDELAALLVEFLSEDDLLVLSSLAMLSSKPSLSGTRALP
jgi:hypothetical protein